MGLIDKPHTFVALTSAQAGQVNANFDLIYNTFNGFITNANISTVAAIAYSKLNLAGSIVDSDIASNAAIAMTKLALTTSPAGQTTLVGTARQILAGTGLTGGGDLSADRTLSVVDDTSIQRVNVQNDGILTGTRPTLNFKDTNNIQINLADQAGVNRVDIDATILAGSVTSTMLKTATGSASMTTLTQVAMNDFSFFPSITSEGSDAMFVEGWRSQADPGNHNGRLLVSPSGGAQSIVRWRYVTASRPPELVVVKNRVTGEVLAVWFSEIDDPSKSPIVVQHPDAETLYIAEFPDRLMNLQADVIMKELKSGQLKLKDEPTAKLAAHAKSKGRVIFQGAKLAKLQ